MQRKSWNDINNEDSSDSEPQEDIINTINLHKRLSAPTIISSSRLKQACDELSLDKIEKHEQKDVWLYIPNAFHSRTDEVTKILQSNHELKNVIHLKNIGWNILAQKQIGRILIKEGYTKDGIYIKFIYSNRNDKKEERDGSNQQRSTKLTKKKTYVQKPSKTLYQQKQYILQEPIQKQQPKVYKQEFNLKIDKKKPKWVQKSKNTSENIQQAVVQVEQINNKQAILSPKKDRKEYEIKSPKHKNNDYNQNKTNKHVYKQQLSPRYKLKYQENKSSNKDDNNQKIVSSKEAKQIQQIQKEQLKGQLKEQIQQSIKDALQQDRVDEKERQGKMINQEKRQSEDEQDDSGESEDRKQKKKKKKKKKNKSGKRQSVTDNNPFSYLMK